MTVVIMLDIRHASLSWLMMTLVICNCIHMVGTSGSFQVRVLSLASNEFKVGPILAKPDDHGNVSTYTNSTMDEFATDACNTCVDICLSHHLLPVPPVIECTLGQASRKTWNPREIIDVPFSFKWPGALTASIKATRLCKRDDKQSNKTISHLIFSHDLVPTQEWTRIAHEKPSSGINADTSDFRLPPRTPSTRNAINIDGQQPSVSDDSDSSAIIDNKVRIDSSNMLENKQKASEIGSEILLETNMGRLIQGSRGSNTGFVVGEGKSEDQLVYKHRNIEQSKTSNVKDFIHRAKGEAFLEMVPTDLESSGNVSSDASDGEGFDSKDNVEDGYEEDIVFGIVSNDHTSISYRTKRRLIGIFRVICQQHYFGDGCSNFCRPRDDIIGHFNCSDKGEKVCLDGWTGSQCAAAVCRQGCPINRGTCTRPDECTCKHGWYGHACEQCRTAHGCRHGQCGNTPGQCLCHKGWTGPLCDVETQYCVDNKPCHNNGKCVHDNAHNYTCQCMSGYTGTNCQVPECHEHFCLHDGTCLTSEGTRYCLCPPPFKGPRCQHYDFQTRETTPEPSINSDVHQKGRTAPLSASNNSHRDVCDDVINCLNGGRCEKSPRGDGYGCVCKEPYEGEFCELDPRNPCEDYFCMNRGRCKVRDGEPSCYCKEGYSGDFCEVKSNTCSGLLCENGGTCVLYKRKHKCACRKNFYGRRCEHKAMKAEPKIKQKEKKVTVNVWTVRVASPIESRASSRPYSSSWIIMLTVLIYIHVLRV